MSALIAITAIGLAFLVIQVVERYGERMVAKIGFAASVLLILLGTLSISYVMVHYLEKLK